MANSDSPTEGWGFISYRREETADAAGWLFNSLADRAAAASVNTFAALLPRRGYRIRRVLERWDTPMRKIGICLVITGVTASLVLSACSSSSKSLSTGVATPGASTEVSAVPSADDGNSSISVAPDARSDPREPAVMALLVRHFTDIEERNFDDYFKLYTPKYRATLGDPAKVAEGYRSTEILDVRLTKLRTSGDGRPAATVTFTSKQDAIDGPDGQTCTRWTKGFFLSNVGGKYLIDFPPTTYNIKYVPC